jgi:hypothetical protein
MTLPHIELLESISHRTNDLVGAVGSKRRMDRDQSRQPQTRREDCRQLLVKEIRLGDVKGRDSGEAIGRKCDKVKHERVQRSAVERAPGQMFEIWTFGNKVQLSQRAHADFMQE